MPKAKYISAKFSGSLGFWVSGRKECCIETTDFYAPLDTVNNNSASSKMLYLIRQPGLRLLCYIRIIIILPIQVSPEPFCGRAWATGKWLKTIRSQLGFLAKWRTWGSRRGCKDTGRMTGSAHNELAQRKQTRNSLPPPPKRQRAKFQKDTTLCSPPSGLSI